MKIAVVGSGISGLSAAYYLSKKHHVDLFEREDHFGGHSHTIDLFCDEKKVSVDIGFIVFNFQTYPNLINFFKENDIQIEKSNMSFSVSVDNTNFEYCGKGLRGIFSNKSNLFNDTLIRLQNNTPKQKILEIQSKIGYINSNNKTLILNKFKIFSQKLYLLNKILNTSSIEKNLKKGYAILKSENQIIKSIQTLKKLSNFDVTLKDGVVSVKKKL